VERAELGRATRSKTSEGPRRGGEKKRKESTREKKKGGGGKEEGVRRGRRLRGEEEIGESQA